MKKVLIGLEQFQVIGNVEVDSCETGTVTIWPEDGSGQLLLAANTGKLGGVNWGDATHLVLEVTGQEDFNPAFVMVFVEGEKLDTAAVIVNAGALPGIRTQISFPLSALDSNTMFIPRTAGSLKQIVLGKGGKRANMTGIVLTTKECHKSQKVIIHEIYFSWGTPHYNVPEVKFIDSLGQLNSRTWAGKTRSEEELINNLNNDLNQYITSTNQGWSRFGGDMSVRWEGTGFFRTHHDGRRWYLVDPDGYRFLSTGLDCCIPGDLGLVSGIEQLYEELPDKKLYGDAYGEPDEHAHTRLSAEHVSNSIVNLIKAFGEEWKDKWTILTKNRLVDWHFNTIGNWSDPEFIHKANLPYVWPMANFPTTEKRIFRDFPDVFSEEYAQNADRFALQLIPFREDPYMIGYFLRNEPEWAFVHNLLIAEKVLENPIDTECKQRFISRLTEKYLSIEALNAAWNRNYYSFDELRLSQPPISTFSEQALQDAKAFSIEMIRQYVSIPSQACKKVDPNHMNLGMRYSMLTDPILIEGYENFDVFSLNGYQEHPFEEVQRVGETTGKPVLIGEFHFGAIDVGMPAAGICSVATQKDRGFAYHIYFQKAMNSPYFVGAHYFSLNDQPVLGRFDGENMQIGLVDVCNKPYLEFINEVRITNKNIYAIADGEGITEPIVTRIPRLMGF